jgi:hypothetical protein
MMVSVIIFSGVVIYTTRDWKKSTAYFKAGFVCWLMTFWGIVFWAIVAIRSSTSSTAVVGYVFLLPFAMFWSCAVWFIVWLGGFLIAKMASSVSNYRKRKHRR